MSIKEEQLNKIFSKYQDCLEENRDLYADEDPSFWFYPLANIFSFLMDNDPEKVISKEGVEIRKHLHKFVKLVGPMFLPCKQVFENRYTLEDSNSKEEDKGIILPEEPVTAITG